jgi:beta-galactosidase
LVGSLANVTGTLQNTISVPGDTARVWRTILKIENPLLWSPKYPNLYVMRVLLKENEKIIDEYYTQFGIRTIKTKEEKVLLTINQFFLQELHDMRIIPFMEEAFQ